MNIFSKTKYYSFDEIAEICQSNHLVTIDCLKDENMVSIEDWDEEGECLGGECLFEFDRIFEDTFVLRWSIFTDNHS